MTISVKLVNDHSVVTVYNPKHRLYFFRPSHLTELDILCEYGEEIGLNIITKKINAKKFNGRAYK
jgi:hypothetical protein